MARITAPDVIYRSAHGFLGGSVLAQADIVSPDPDAWGELFVSDISCWEISVKSANGHLELSIDAALWLERAEQAPGIHFLPVSRQVLVLCTRLSGTVRNDPADRMLLAAAPLHAMPLLTADAELVEYGRRHRGVRLIDAR